MERLADLLAADPLDPMIPQIVVVPHRSLAGWLELELARRLGICANVRFLQPATLLWELVAALGLEQGEAGRYSEAPLAWRLYYLLPEMAQQLPELGRYLEPGDELRRYHLARELAAVYARYLVYRPGLLLEWERGQARDWQARLWQRLVQDSHQAHWARIQQRLLTRLEHGAGLPPAYQHLLVFGLEGLAPGYIAVLEAVAREGMVQLFALDPCEEFWSDLVSERERLRRMLVEPQLAEAMLTGNPLLASLGRMGRERLGLLLQLEALDRRPCFTEPQECSLLGTLQRELMRLQAPGTGLAAAGNDGSIQLHACHSPLREVEVLHDQLLGMFDRDPQLRPDQVLVLLPEPERYAPAVRAVFGQGPLPFQQLEQPDPAEAGLGQAWLELLALGDSRFSLREVMGLLDYPSVSTNYQLDGEDLDQLRRWLQDNGVSWGRDAGHREAEGQPGEAGHTWRDGLDRLLLGHAMPDGELCDGLLPQWGMEGENRRRLARLIRFVEALFQWQEQCRHPRPPTDWARLFGRTLEGMFRTAGPGEAEGLRRALVALAEEARLAGPGGPVAFPVVRERLKVLLASGGHRWSGPAGGITFAPWGALKGVPFAVVCILGLDFDRLPRRDRRPDFDRMAEQRRAGDPSQRDEDRELLLAALLAAQRVLYLSHVGADQHDDTPRPPSVLVGELLEYLRRGGVETGELVHRHPLQSFSPRYFTPDSPALFSYREDLCRALAGRDRGDPGERPWLAGPLPDPEPEREIDREQLQDYFANPCRALLRRLGLRFEWESGLLPEEDPFELQGLQAYALRSRLLEWWLEHGSLTAEQARALAAPMLPAGDAGELLLAGAYSKVQRIASCFLALRAGEHERMVDRLLELGPTTLSGRWWLSGGRLLRARAGRLRGRDRLSLWLDHLLLSATGQPVESVVLGMDRSMTLPALPAGEAERHLEALLALRERGLREPLPLFPESGWDLVSRPGREPAAAIRQSWQGNAFQDRPGERDDPAVALLFRDPGPLPPEPFTELAHELFGPLLAHATEEELA